MENNLIISHMTLRKVIGILGVSLAFICILGGLAFGSGVIEDSISAYYLTNMRDVLVAVLSIAGAFLLTYKGYDKMDNILSSIAGVSGLGIAIFPMDFIFPGNVFGLVMPTVAAFHYAFTVIFFATLAVISFFQFTKTGGNPSPQKLKRNWVYRICGVVIFLTLLILALGFLEVFATGYYFVLIVEIIMLFAFGTSWLVKGEFLLKDA